MNKNPNFLNYVYFLKDKRMLNSANPDKVVRIWEKVTEIIFPSYVSSGGFECLPKPKLGVKR